MPSPTPVGLTDYLKTPRRCPTSAPGSNGAGALKPIRATAARTLLSSSLLMASPPVRGTSSWHRDVETIKVRHLQPARTAPDAWQGLLRAIKDPSVRSLAPVWLCVNAVVGLWLGPTLPFLMTKRPSGSQYLDGIFANTPTQVGWLLLGYSAVFGAGVFGWSFLLPRMQIRSAMRLCLLAMAPVCLGLFTINHSARTAAPVRWSMTAGTALLIMVESGFTPAALAWLAQSLGPRSGKGAAMGIYSVLLSVGAIGGSLLAGVLGKALSVDGLLLGTVLLAACALLLLHKVTVLAVQPFEESYEQA